MAWNNTNVAFFNWYGTSVIPTCIIKLQLDVLATSRCCRDSLLSLSLSFSLKKKLDTFLHENTDLSLQSWTSNIYVKWLFLHREQAILIFSAPHCKGTLDLHVTWNVHVKYFKQNKAFLKSGCKTSIHFTHCECLKLENKTKFERSFLWTQSFITVTRSEALCPYRDINGVMYCIVIKHKQ